MAENIEQSIIGLKNSIDALSTRIRSTGERQMTSLESSPSLERVNKLIEVSAEVDRIYEKKSKANDLLRAARAMRHDPDRWNSPGEYLRWEAARKERRRGTIDAIRGIVQPDIQHKIDLARRFGRSGAEQVLAAETYSKSEEGRKAYEFDILPESEKRVKRLSEKYGGGAEGEARARNIIAREQRENIAKLQMSDYEAFIHDHSVDYGGRAGADIAYRKLLIKQLPSFFKDSKLSTKSLIAIQRTLRATRGTPVFGPMLYKMISNPVAGSAGLAYAGMLAGFQASDKANEKVVGWQNAVNLYGSPSRRFTQAAMLAGVKDPGQVAKLYGEMTSRFGNAEMFMASIGGTLGNMDPLARIRLAKDLGLDETAIAMIDIFSQNKHLKVDEARKTNKNKNIVDAVKEFGYTTGSGFGNTAQSWWLSIPGMKSGAARDMTNLDYVREGYMNNFFDAMNSAVEKTQDAAGSLKDTEAKQGSTSNYNSTSNHSQYFNEVNIVAKGSVKDVISDLGEMSDGGTMNNRAVLASVGSGMLA